jgi:hypothetical protein
MYVLYFQAVMVLIVVTGHCITCDTCIKLIQHRLGTSEAFVGPSFYRTQHAVQSRDVTSRYRCAGPGFLALVQWVLRFSGDFAHDRTLGSRPPENCSPF